MTTDGYNYSEFFTERNLYSRLPMAGQIFLATLYSVTTLLAVVGNSLAIFIFTTGKRSRKSSFRHFLVNLAVADLIMALFCMPFSFTQIILRDWIFSAPMCTLVSFLQVLSVTASAATNVAIGIDRYRAIVRPLNAYISTPHRRLVLLVLWLVAGLLSSVQLFVARQMTDENINGRFCAEDWPKYEYYFGYTCFLLLTNCLIPLGVLIVTYGCVCLHLLRHSRPGNIDRTREALQNKTKRKVP